MIMIHSLLSLELKILSLDIKGRWVANPTF